MSDVILDVMMFAELILSRKKWLKFDFGQNDVKELLL